MSYLSPAKQVKLVFFQNVQTLQKDLVLCSLSKCLTMLLVSENRRLRPQNCQKRSLKRRFKENIENGLLLAQYDY